MFSYPNELQQIFDKLLQNEIKPVIVGGFVRDYFLQINSKDIDIELYNVNNFEEIFKILENFGNPNETGKSFGVIKLSIDNYELDFSLPRLDNKVSKGHKGFEVQTFKNLDFKTASFRRDFTINSIGYDIINKEFLDFYNGINDIKTKRLRYIDKNSFEEDPLRILRAVQFCARFEFEMDDKLFLVCKSMVKQNSLNELPHERIFTEIKKLLLKAKKPSIGLKLLKKLDINIFEISDKKLLLIDNFKTNITTNTKTKLSVMLAILYKDSNYDLNIISNSKTLEKNIKIFLNIEKFLLKKTGSIAYNIAKNLDLDILELFLKAINVDNKILKKINLLKPNLHGKDLIKKGIKPSKEFANILQNSYDKQLELNF